MKSDAFWSLSQISIIVSHVLLVSSLISGVALIAFYHPSYLDMPFIYFTMKGKWWGQTFRSVCVKIDCQLLKLLWMNTAWFGWLMWYCFKITKFGTIFISNTETVILLAVSFVSNELIYFVSEVMPFKDTVLAKFMWRKNDE